MCLDRHIPESIPDNKKEAQTFGGHLVVTQILTNTHDLEK